MLIKTEYTIIFKFKYVSTTVFFNFTTLYVIKGYKVRKIYYDISNLFIYEFSAFQMSYIYHQVAILADKFLIKKHVLSIHHTGKKQL